LTKIQTSVSIKCLNFQSRRSFMFQLLARLGERSAKRPWRVLITFILSIVLLGGVAGAVGAGFTTEVRIGDTDSQQATDLLVSEFPQAAGDTATLVFHADTEAGVTDPDVQARLIETFDEIANQEDVDSVTPLQISEDKTTGFVNVVFDKPAADLSASHLERLELSVEQVQELDVETSMRGPVVDRWRDREPPIGEFLGILAAFVLITLLFRSFTATMVTIGAALIGLILGNSVLAVVSGFTDIPSVAPTIAIMLGLGAGIDYALFMVARYRARLRAGDDRVTAAANANGSTGKSIITAGAIVVVSILGLYVTGIDVIGRMGLAAAIVVAVTAITAVTLVPAFLKMAGRRVLPRKERKQEQAVEVSEATEGERSRRIASSVAKRPWIWTTASTLLLLFVASPALNLQLGQPDDGNRPIGDTMRVAYDRLDEGFGVGFNGPLLVAIDLNTTNAYDLIPELTEELSALDGVAAVGQPQLSDDGDVAVLTVIAESAPQDKETSDLVAQIRSNVIPQTVEGTDANAYVGGQTATFDDLATKVSDSLVLLVLVVVGLSLLLLTYFFRSILLPIASAFMNLLSIGAAYGVVTLAFQTEWGAALLGVDQQPVVSFVPMLMFAILFGLSMDYNVFLISAVREAKDAGETARAALIRGVGKTASLISVAGAIMALVFLGFMITTETEVKMIGLGLAVAVIVDVTIVRLVLAPALITLLGERAWWLPMWLDKRLGKQTAMTH
jgi:RND superfamily putative drug exporter